MTGSRKFTPSIRLTAITAFAAATLLTAALAIGLHLYFSKALAREAAADLYAQASQGVANELRDIDTRNRNAVELLADNPALLPSGDEYEALHLFTEVMERNPMQYGIFLGRGDGSFFEVINLAASDMARRSLRALPVDRWLVLTVYEKDGQRLRKFDYYDQWFSLRARRIEPTDYDPRTRPWYRSALSSSEAVRSDPYLFAQLGQPGQTVSQQVGFSDTVLGIDVTMATTSEFLADQVVAESGELFLYNADGDITASSRAEDMDRPGEFPMPPFEMSEEEQQLVASLPELVVSNEMDWPPFDYTVRGEPRGYSIDVMRFIARITGLRFAFVNGLSWEELTRNFRHGEIDILQSVIPTRQNEGWGLFSESYAHLPFALVSSNNAEPVSSLAELRGRRLAIPKDWSITPAIKAAFPEIKIIEAGGTLGALRAVIFGRADAAIDNEVILRHVAAYYYLSGLHFESAPDLGQLELPDTLRVVVRYDQPELLALINRAIDAIGETQRDYLVTQWLDFETGPGGVDSGKVPHRALIDLVHDSAMQDQLLEYEIDGTPHFVFGTPLAKLGSSTMYFGLVVPESAVVGPFMEKVRLSTYITMGFLAVFLPLLVLLANPIVRPIKQLAVENDKVRDRQYDAVKQVTTNIRELDDLSESMLEMVSSIKAHELAQRRLMDSFIQLIAEAIDDKSPYTGGHCERVPELALMLAESASQSHEPPFDRFELKDDDEWREYRIAAWLHDCGKITTPEHIVDKGSKLEIIYNRIHEVRMRFEVLYRDAEIEYYRALAQDPGAREALQAGLAARRQQLQDDFAFVAECNVGGEFLDEEKQQRLRRIGQTLWTRYFDNRIGLSPVEELRLQGDPAPLPAEEPLLADRAEHIIERTRPTDYPPEYGINMDIPVHQYNQGEIYNLSISRGTLTAEDRFKINEHMISTIKMLESLPFPEELKHVPRYASTHHETMRGSGYPRKLPGDQLSIPERILAVADIFEALTASDRPYKKAKTVSEAVDILYKMVLDNHVDRDCFELFLRDGVYLRYAEAFLAPEQIDAVDIARYLDSNEAA